LARCRPGWADAHPDGDTHGHTDRNVYGNVHADFDVDRDVHADCDVDGTGPVVRAGVAVR
jgi:hypothetical protein